MREKINLKGQRFGRYTVIESAESKDGKSQWICKCDCGNIRIVEGGNLRNGHSKSCGCLNREITKSLAKDLTNQKFSLWYVIEKAPYKNGKIMWHCRCECGTERDLTTSQLISGRSKSCGCLKRKILAKNHTTHGMRKTRIYGIYSDMLARCFNKNNKAYPLYGGAGIKVCQEWLGENGFTNFAKWAYENGYTDKLTLDRYPNYKGNYEPNNCRWATMKQQGNNRNNNVYITREGETHTMSEWCEILGIPYYLVNSRRQKGWSEDKLFLPIQRKGRRSNG